MSVVVTPKAHAIPRPQAIAVTLGGGLLAGLLDGLDAIVFYGLTSGTSFVQIFRYIASGLLGPRAFAGGWHAVALGIALHFLIAIGAASVYYAASLLQPAFLRRPWLWGPVFGVGVYFFMQNVVIPLSLVRRLPHSLLSLEFVDLIISHMMFVGFPIAWMARLSSRAR